MKLRNLLSMFKVGETKVEQTQRFLEQRAAALEQRAAALERAHDKLKVAEDLAKVCEMVIDIKHCMMFEHIHADFGTREVLAKYRVQDVQTLAKITQDAAEEALKKWQKYGKQK